MKRHLTVLGIAIIGLVVGIVLVVTGRDSSVSSTKPTTPSTEVRKGPLLPSLGEVADDKAALELLTRVDPATLHLEGTTTTPPETSSPPTSTAFRADAAGVQRCQQAVAQQTTDRSLGRRRGAARLSVGRHDAFVLSYRLPASGSSPEADRLILVDVGTCRILGAVDR